jgi:hypothetical protein
MWIVASAAACVVILGCAGADAAVIKAAAVACKNEPLIVKPVEKPKGKTPDPASLRSKGATGDCMQFARGQQVSVDEKHGDLWCVRPMGALDCFWTSDKGVDLNAAPSTDSASQPRQSRRH